MRIGGLQKLAMVDFPGKVAATVFTSGCNLRCPFCHNAPLVTRPELAEERAEEDVTHGIPLSKPLEESEVFPPMVYHMIGIGEETGNMEEMLDKIADYYDEEVEMATQSLVAALEPLIIVVMALVVVPIILAVMMPMFSLYNAI